MPKPDAAHLQTDKELAKLEKRIAKIYKEAADDLQKTIDDYFAKFAKRDAKQRARLEAGEITEQEYKQWRLAQMGRGERFKALQSRVAERYTEANETAVRYVNDATPGIYSLNRNYSAYTIEKVAGNVGFDLWDEQTVRRLIVENPEVMPYYPPEKALKRGIDLAYGKKQISASVTSSILQGKSIPRIAKDLQTRMPEMNKSSAIRTARTAVTGAQNAGRMDSYVAAEKMGIKVRKEWLATLDGRTRHSHAVLDGERVDNEKKFSNGCMFPGDPNGRPEEVYNCFVGETKVASDSDVVRSYKHKYDGKIISIKTAGGVQFSCTPNHPILTPGGWVAAELLNNGNNILVTFGENNVFSGVNPNINHRFPRIDTIHKFWKKFRSKRTSCLCVDFHGDVATSNVEIVTHERLLRDVMNSGGRNGVDKFLLELSNKTLSRFCPLFKHFWSVCKTSFGFIGCKCKSLPFFKCSVSHSCEHGFGTVANRDVVLAEYSINDLPADTVIDGELLNRLSCKVFLDTIVSVDVSVLSTHVYNLQTENGYYFVNSSIAQSKSKCNGIFAIAKNCRCTMIAAVDGVDTSDAKRRARDPETGEPVLIENMSYAEWAGWKEKRKTLSINDAKSVKDVETIFRDRDWFIHGEGKLAGWRSDEGLSLDGLDVESAKYVYSTYEKFFDKFPQLKNKLAAPISSKLDVAKYAECTMGFGSGIVNISKGKYANYEKMKRNIEKMVSDGWFSSKDMIMHELGHSVDDYLSCNLNLFGVRGKSKTDFVSNKVRAQILRESGIKLGDIKNEVSEYATTNAHEWFAECFAEYMTSDSPRKCASKLGEWVEKQIYGGEI